MLVIEKQQYLVQMWLLENAIIARTLHIARTRWFFLNGIKNMS
jgi:hypothetical protein